MNAFVASYNLAAFSLAGALAVSCLLTAPCAAGTRHASDIAEIKHDYRIMDLTFSRRDAAAAAEFQSPVYTHIGLKGQVRTVSPNEQVALAREVYRYVTHVTAHTTVNDFQLTAGGLSLRAFEVDRYTLTINGNSGVVDARQVSREFWVRGAKGQWLQKKTVELSAAYRLDGAPVANPFDILRDRKPAAKPDDGTQSL